MRPLIGILGGTGPHGRGIALRLREAGYDVLIGSRDVERAASVVAELPAARAKTPGTIGGASNDDVAAQGTAIIVTTPWDGFEGLAASVGSALAGKLVVSCANPLRFEGGGPIPVRLEQDGSAAEMLQRLCPEARVVSGFQNVSAVKLGDLDVALEGDVLLCGDDQDAIVEASELVDAIDGLRALNAGPLRLSGIAEDLTVLLISMNKRYRTNASVVITGVVRPGE
jgi:NADPH-dependent F420 reductase